MKFAIFLLFILTCRATAIRCSYYQPNTGMGELATNFPPSRNLENGEWVEVARCGPGVLRYNSELIECNQIIATCADWATFRTRNVNGKLLRSIVIDGQVIPLEEIVTPKGLCEIIGLADFCAEKLAGYYDFGEWVPDPDSDEI